jgi:uncharacterized membrane protein (GlpM family)
MLCKEKTITAYAIAHSIVGVESDCSSLTKKTISAMSAAVPYAVALKLNVPVDDGVAFFA